MAGKIKQDENIGQNLKKLRLAHGYSQEVLCGILQRDGCDIGRTTYQKYENGELNIRVSVLRSLVKLYKCSFDDFFV